MQYILYVRYLSCIWLASISLLGVDVEGLGSICLFQLLDIWEAQIFSSELSGEGFRPPDSSSQSVDAGTLFVTKLTASDEPPCVLQLHDRWWFGSVHAAAESSA